MEHLGPGLNAMANHGYLPRNGVGSMQQFIDGTAEVFGLGGSPNNSADAECLNRQQVPTLPPSWLYTVPSSQAISLLSQSEDLSTVC